MTLRKRIKLVLALTLSFFVAAPAQPLKVSPDGRSFVENGKPFF